MNEQEIHDFIRANRNRRIEDIALNLSRESAETRLFILQQIEGGQKLTAKAPAFVQIPGILFPPRISLEQCSSETTAQYKAEIIKRILPEAERHSFCDLTGGMGIDFKELAPLFVKSIFVERQENLIHVAQHNFPLLGLNHSCIVQADAEDILTALELQDLIFIDPARRDENGGRTIRIEDCSPNVKALLPKLLSHARHLLIKLSPMLDIHQSIDDLGCVREVHVVCVRGECKEVLLLCTSETTTRDIEIHTLNDDQHFSFSLIEESESPCSLTDEIATYLYEPNSGVLKAGGFKTIARRFELKKLHSNTHLYTSSDFIVDFPGRVFRVNEVKGFGKKEIRQLSQLGRANLTVRNFPETVAQIRNRLKLSEGGDIYLFACTVMNGKKVIIVTSKVNTMKPI